MLVWICLRCRGSLHTMPPAAMSQSWHTRGLCTAFRMHGLRGCLPRMYSAPNEFHPRSRVQNKAGLCSLLVFRSLGTVAHCNRGIMITIRRAPDGPKDYTITFIFTIGPDRPFVHDWICSQPLCDLGCWHSRCRGDQVHGALSSWYHLLELSNLVVPRRN